MKIDVAALKKLEEYDFPGNVRELENMIERAIVVGNGREIRLRDLPFEKELIQVSDDSLKELERKYIMQNLNRLDWNISRTAKALKIDRVTLYSKIKKYKLKPPEKKK